MLLNDFFKIQNLSIHSPHLGGCGGLPNNTILARIELNEKHPIFKGHFPGNPIVPGVCMIEMTKEVLAKAMDKKLQLKQANNIKFLAFIDPRKNKLLDFQLSYFPSGDTLLLVQNEITFEGKTFFKFKGGFLII